MITLGFFASALGQHNTPKYVDIYDYQRCKKPYNQDDNKPYKVCFGVAERKLVDNSKCPNINIRIGSYHGCPEPIYPREQGGNWYNYKKVVERCKKNLSEKCRTFMLSCWHGYFSSTLGVSGTKGQRYVIEYEGETIPWDDLKNFCIQGEWRLKENSCDNKFPLEVMDYECLSTSEKDRGKIIDDSFCPELHYADKKKCPLKTLNKIKGKCRVKKMKPKYWQRYPKGDGPKKLFGVLPSEMDDEQFSKCAWAVEHDFWYFDDFGDEPVWHTAVMQWSVTNQRFECYAMKKRWFNKLRSCKTGLARTLYQVKLRNNDLTRY